MTAQVLQFPSRAELPYRPNFREFVAAEMGLVRVNRVYRVKRRTPTCQGVPWGDHTVLLTQKDYDAAKGRYQARFGKTYEWQ